MGHFTCFLSYGYTIYLFNKGLRGDHYNIIGELDIQIKIYILMLLNDLSNLIAEQNDINMPIYI